MSDIRESVRESIDLEFPIKTSQGEGFEFNLHGLDYSTKGWYREDGKRRVSIDIRSYVGYGGVHYYGDLKCNIANNQVDGNSSVGGYLGGIKIPEDKESFDLELVRSLTQKEMDDDKNRWETYEVGDKVNAFYSEKEVRDLAVQVFEDLFDDGWYLVIEGLGKTETIEKS